MASEQGYKQITPEEVQAKLTPHRFDVLVDVRQPWEYELRHIPGVILMPMDEFAARCQSELNSGDEIICICEHGIRSAMAAQYLAALGFENVATMVGGMAAYTGPMESGT